MPDRERQAPGSPSMVWQKWFTRADIDVDNETNQRDQAGNEATRSQPPQAGNAASRIRKANVRAALFKKPDPVRIGRFVLLERLGAGAMGEVYAAYDEQLDRKVALKLVRSSARDSDRGDERLLREAQTLAQVSHPNVVQVYEAGTHDGGVFIAMEFIRGKTLSAWLDAAKELPWPERQREILRQFIAAGRGLEAAHAAGLAHRDFKPDNVLVGADGRVRVVDFGLARVVADPTTPLGTTTGTTRAVAPAPAPGRKPAQADTVGMAGEPTWGMETTDAPEEERADAPTRKRLGMESTASAAPAEAPDERSPTPGTAGPEAPHVKDAPDVKDATSRPGEPTAQRKAAVRLTVTGMVMGTPRYMAPEQMQGATPDHRSDQFSFCVALFHALYGEWPFQGTNAYDLMRAAARGKIVTPKNQAEVPAAVRKAILRGLSAEPEDRFANMGDLLHVLEARLLRARRGLWRFAAAALMTGSAVAFAAVDKAPEPCAEVTGEIDALWSLERKDRLGQAFLGSGQVYAEDAWRSTERAIDAYVAAWRSGARDACEATHVRQTQSPDLLDRRMLCLDRGRQRLAALLGSFDAGTMPNGGTALLDAKLVERALDAASALPDLAICSNAEALLADVEPPAPGIAASVTEVRQRLAEAYTHALLGHSDRALRVAEEQRLAVEDLAYPPVHAEVLYHVGAARAARGKDNDHVEATAAYLDAVDIAEGARHDQLTIQIWNKLVLLAATYDSSTERGHAWSRREQAAVRRVGSPAMANAHALYALGLVYAKDADHAAAAKQYRDAAAIVEATAPRSLLLPSVYHAWANSELGLGRQGEAQTLFRRALELLTEQHGNKHPEVARAQNDLARLLLEIEDFDGARELLEAALTTSKQTLGRDHYLTGKILLTLARVEARANHFGQARAHAEEGRRIYSNSFEPEHRSQADPITCLGVIDLRQGDFAAAHRAFERAMDIRRRHLDDGHAMIHWTRYYLAESLIGLKRYDAALEQFAAIAASTAEGTSVAADLHALLLSARGRALLGRGDVALAIEVLGQALSEIRELRGLWWERAETMWALARALRASGKDTEMRARSLAEEARAVYATRGPTDGQMRAAITTWLDEHAPR